MTTTNARIQERRDTAANWASANPILAEGEVGLDLTNDITKTGDGVTAWLSLPSSADALIAETAARVAADTAEASARASADTAAIATAAADATTKANAAQAAAIAAAATDATTKANAAQAASQPLDSDLTAFAGKTAPSGAVVGTTDTQTLTNKTLTAPVISAPTGLVKGDVGLGSVDNTADSAKPVSTAQAAADAAVASAAATDATTKANAAQAAAIAASQPLDSDLTAFAGKTAPAGAVVGTTDTQTLTNKTLTSPTITTPTGLVKGDVGLGNVNNTTDANKPVSTAQQAALDTKEALVPRAGATTGQVPVLDAGTGLLAFGTVSGGGAGASVLTLAVGAAVPGGTPANTLIFREGGGSRGVVGVGHVDASTLTNPVDITLSADVPAGATIVANIGYALASGAEVPWVATDPRGNVWTASAHYLATTTGTALLYCHVAAELKAGMVVKIRPATGGGNSTKVAAVLGAFDGLLLPVGPDVTGVASAGSGNVSVATSAPTTQGAEIVFAGVGSTWSTPGTGTSGWALVGSEATTAGEKRSGLFFKLVSAIGVQTATVTAGTGGAGWAAAIAAFKLDTAPKLEGLWDGTVVDTLYPLGKPAKGGMVYISRDNGTQRWRSDEVDPRDFAGDTAGVFGMGNSSKDTACLLAATAACERENGGFTSGLTLKFPAATRMYVEAPLVQRAPYTVRGGGKYSSILIPTPAMVGQWVWTLEDLCRNASRADSSTEMDWTKTRTGPALSNWSIMGKRTDGVIHGLRTTGSMDDAMFDHMAIIYLAGIGMRLGDPNPAAGLSQGGIVRESEFVDIRVEQCGSDTNLSDPVYSDAVYGIPAFDFCQAQDGVTTVDGSNQVHFNGLFICFNHGIGWFRNYSATEVMRRIEIQGFQLHANTDTGSQTQDLLVVEGNIQSFKTRNCRTNSAPVGKACILVKGHVGAGRPRVDLDVNISSTFGDGVVIEDADSVTITGRSQPSNTGGSEIRIPATSTYSPAGPVVGFVGMIDLMSSNNPSVARKFSVAPNVNDIIDFRMGVVVRATTAQLTDKTHLVNTFGKSTGRKVTNTTSGIQMYAQGTADTSTWKDAVGGSTITPV